MGDRGHNRHGPKRGGGAAVPLSRRAGTPRLIQCGLGRSLLPYQVAFIHPAVWPQWAKNWVVLGVPFFLGVAGSQLPTEHKVTWAEAYLHTKWHLSPSSRLATTDIGRKLGAVPLGFRERGAGSCAHLGDEELGPHLTQCRIGRAYLRTKWHLDPCSRLAQ